MAKKGKESILVLQYRGLTAGVFVTSVPDEMISEIQQSLRAFTDGEARFVRYWPNEIDRLDVNSVPQAQQLLNKWVLDFEKWKEEQRQRPKA